MKQLDLTLSKAQMELSEIKAEKNDLDKELIKKTEDYVSYLKKCKSELQKNIKINMTEGQRNATVRKYMLVYLWRLHKRHGLGIIRRFMVHHYCRHPIWTAVL